MKQNRDKDGRDVGAEEGDAHCDGLAESEFVQKVLRS
jgi:hypothetical protein